MARIARIVIPHHPHHVTQRGSRRQQVFFSDRDYQKYLDLLAKAVKTTESEIWAYCLMPNHVHLVVVPDKEDSLRAMLSSAHRNYAQYVNLREGWSGHLWQERFYSTVMDENYLLAVVRYTELNPVRAGLCERPEQWPWSSARPHLAGNDDSVVRVKPMLERVGNWSDYLSISNKDELASIRKHQKSGRPLGGEEFISKVEAITGRSLKMQKRGPKVKSRECEFR